MMRQNIALKVVYDGTPFFGWQKNRAGPSIEETLQKVLEQILQERVTLQAASRTDRGVHAEGQWVNFCTEKAPPSLQSLNALLPPTIRIASIHRMPLTFHPTLDAQKKEYHYRLCNGFVQLPQDRFFSWHLPHVLDIEKMQAASHYFIGEHDFSSFCNYQSHQTYKDKKRTIEKIELLSFQEHILFVIIGNLFLYKMVRNIVGTLVYVGRKKIAPEQIPQILTLHSRSAAGITAPAHGLTLKKIYYPQEFNLEL